MLHPIVGDYSAVNAGTSLFLRNLPGLDEDKSSNIAVTFYSENFHRSFLFHRFLLSVITYKIIIEEKNE